MRWRGGRRFRRLLGGLLTVVAFSLAVFAISSPADAQDAPELAIVESSSEGRQVSLTVVAPDELRDGEVTLGSFAVEIDNQLLAPRVSLVAGDELDVVLLVDVSGSMTPEALAAAKASGEAFVSQLPDRARVSIVTFGDTVSIVQPFTTDVSLISSTLDSLQAGGETALYAGVLEAARQFNPASESIRTVVLLSDGGNTVDESSLGSAQAALASSGATLHAISIDTAEADLSELEALATASDGSVSRVDQVGLVEELYRALAVDLRNQYRLEFEAPGEGLTTAVVSARQGDRILSETTISLTLPAAPIAPLPAPTAAQVVPAPVNPPARATASPPAVTTIDAGADQLLKWGAILLVAVAIATLASTLLIPGERPRSRRVKPSERFAVAGSSDRSSGVRRFTEGLTGTVESLLNGERFGPWLGALLDTAGWKIRNSEFVVLVGLIAIFGFFAGAISSFWMGVSLALLVFVIVGVLLMLMVARRRDAFANQLNGTLQMMSGALRTGYSLPQVIALVGQESNAPTSEEFSRVAVEMRLGRDLVESVRAVGERMKNADFLWTTGAIEIAREVGGDLAEVLDNVGATVRTRERVRRQIQALSAEGRVSAWILIALPFPIFIWQFLVNRSYTMLLFNTTMGLAIFLSGVSLLVIGFFWLRAQIRIEY